jgi:hypothetical protein
MLELEKPKKKFKCPTCNKEYQRPSWYKKHLKTYEEKYKNKKIFITEGDEIRTPGNLTNYFPSN